ncbi:MAG: hypothetical protein ACOYMA_02010 [Bacteroidia bacterium]
MINHKPHKKLYYTSGLISLLLLPILCVLYLQKTKVFEPEYAIELNMWYPEQAKSWREYGYDYDVHPNRNFINIYLTGNEKEDRIKLDFVQLQLRDLVKSKETISGVHIILGNNSKYWTLIEIINISMKERARRFTYIGNDFWFFNYFPKPVVKKEVERGWLCGTRDANYLGNLEEQEKQNQILKELKETPKTLITLYISLSVLFLVMCGIEIKRLLSLR